MHSDSCGILFVRKCMAMRSLVMRPAFAGYKLKMRVMKGLVAVSYISWAVLWVVQELWNLSRALHSKENSKHNPNSATTLPNTKFIFPKQIFVILCGPSLPMRPKARVLALISIMPKLISAVYQQLDCQMHTAEQLLSVQAAWVALPSVHHGKNHSCLATIL